IIDRREMLFNHNLSLLRTISLSCSAIGLLLVLCILLLPLLLCRSRLSSMSSILPSAAGSSIHRLSSDAARTLNLSGAEEEAEAGDCASSSSHHHHHHQHVYVKLDKRRHMDEEDEDDATDDDEEDEQPAPLIPIAEHIQPLQLERENAEAILTSTGFTKLGG